PGLGASHLRQRRGAGGRRQQVGRDLDWNMRRRPSRGWGPPAEAQLYIMAAGMDFLIIRHPAPAACTPVLVSVPHYGTQPLPHISRDDYSEPWFETFAYGFADTFVGDLYSDLHEHGATVLTTPFSRIFVDVNRRRDDFEHQDGEVRSRRGVVETVAQIFTRHGFEVHQNVSGYAGGNIVATFGQPQTRRVHALQLEVNASLLMTTTRDEFIAQVSRGEIPQKADENIARVRRCLQEVLAALPAVLAAVGDQS